MRNSQRPKTPAKHAASAFTLVELMIALMIIALTAVAAASLLGSTMAAQKYVKSSAASTSQVELSISRMTDIIRAATAASVGTNSIQLTTPADSNNNIYHVTYALSSGSVTETYVNVANGQTLTSSTMISNVTQFSVAALSGNPKAFQITVSANSGPFVVQRTFVAFGRNL